MPFPGGFGTSLATVLGGQAQANQATALQAQEIQQRQLEEQLKRQQLLMQLQDMTATQKALGTLPQDEQNYLRLGGSVDAYQKRQDLSTQASALADQLYQRGLDPNLPMDQRMQAMSAAAQLRAHPELVPQFKDLTSGIGGKQTRPYTLVDKDTGTPVAWDQTGNPPANAIPISEYNNLHNPSRMTPVQKFGDTPIGALPGGGVILKLDGTTFADPRITVDEAMAKAPGSVLLSGPEAKQYNLSKSAEQNLDVLDQAGKQVLPANVPSGFGETVRDIAINPARRALLAKVDPKYAAYEHSKAGIISYVRDLANAGRINQAEMSIIVDRLNNAQTYPALKSAVDTARDIIQKDRAGLARTGQFSRPVYDASGQIIGYTNDGKTMTPVGP